VTIACSLVGTAACGFDRFELRRRASVTLCSPSCSWASVLACPHPMQDPGHSRSLSVAQVPPGSGHDQFIFPLCAAESMRRSQSGVRLWAVEHLQRRNRDGAAREIARIDWPGFLSSAHLQALVAAGDEIGDHAMDHVETVRRHSRQGTL